MPDDPGAVPRDAEFDRLHLVGYSAGGASCLAFTAQHPDRLQSLDRPDGVIGIEIGKYARPHISVRLGRPPPHTWHSESALRGLCQDLNCASRLGSEVPLPGTTWSDATEPPAAG